RTGRRKSVRPAGVQSSVPADDAKRGARAMEPQWTRSCAQADVGQRRQRRGPGADRGCRKEARGRRLMWLREHIEAPHWLHEFFVDQDPFDSIMQLHGEVFRDVPGRKTIRVRIGGKCYFVKQHFGVGWREIFKNLT